MKPLRWRFSFLRGLSTAPITWLLLFANIVIFGAMLQAGGSLSHSDRMVQLAWGANFAPATQHGEWWRLFTALFLHFGLLHLTLNMWSLWDMGRLLERRIGSVRFLLIYSLGGVIGNLFSLAAQGNIAVSGGASSALFGILAALLAHTWSVRRTLPRTEFNWLFKGGSVFAVLALGAGFFIQGIDNFAHTGGFVSGLLLGTILIPGNHQSPSKLRLACGALLALLVATILAWLPPPAYAWQDETSARQAIQKFIRDDAQIETNWSHLLQEGALGHLSPEEVATKIDAEVIGHYEDSFEALSHWSQQESLPAAKTAQKLRRYVLRRRALAEFSREQLRRDEPTPYSR